MELIGIIALTGIIGAAARYTIPGREFYGATLLPAASMAVGTLAWAGLTWLGWTADGFWIWVVSLGASVAVSVLIAVILPTARRADDERYLANALANRAG